MGNHAQIFGLSSLVIKHIFMIVLLRDHILNCRIYYKICIVKHKLAMIIFPELLNSKEVRAYLSIFNLS